MMLRTGLLTALLLVLPGSDGFAQSTPPPSTGIGPGPISDIDRLTRQREALQARTDTIATLLLSYKSSGELTSSLEKTNPQGLVVRALVGGTQIKKLAKGDKPKVATGIEPGLVEVEATWMRPGTRLKTKCETTLDVGFYQAWILPYGGNENFSCEIAPRSVPAETIETWVKSLDPGQISAVSECAGSDAVADNRFWACIDRAGLPLPSA